MKRLMQMTSKGASLILDNPKNEEEARKQVFEKTLIAFNRLYELEDLISKGKLIEKVFCKECKHFEPEDKYRGYCMIKNEFTNKQSFCEAMER